MLALTFLYLEVWLVEVSGEEVPEEGLGEAGFALVESQRRVASSQVHRLLQGAGMNEVGKVKVGAEKSSNGSNFRIGRRLLVYIAFLVCPFA